MGRDAVARCLESSGQPAAASRLLSCGSWYMAECPECGVEVAPRQNHCRLRVCLACAAREARKRFGVLRSIVLYLNTYKRGSWRLITLTTRNPQDGGDPARMEKQLRTGGKALYKLWRNILRKAGPHAGAAAGMEVGPNGNVHIHVLHFGDFVDQKKVKAAWQRLTSAFIVDIRRVRGMDTDGLMGSLAEVTKYICDPRKMDARMVAAVNKATRNLRCYRTYGSLFAQADSDFETEPLQCPACLYDGAMRHGRSLCPEEADAIASGVCYARRLGSKMPMDLLGAVFKGLNYHGNFMVDLPPAPCHI